MRLRSFDYHLDEPKVDYLAQITLCVELSFRVCVCLKPPPLRNSVMQVYLRPYVHTSTCVRLEGSFTPSFSSQRGDRSAASRKMSPHMRTPLVAQVVVMKSCRLRQDDTSSVSLIERSTATSSTPRVTRRRTYSILHISSRDSESRVDNSLQL